MARSSPEAERRPAEVGLVLLDSSMRVIYSNEEPLNVFSYPNKPGRRRALKAMLAERIQAIYDEKALANNSPVVFMSGRRRYVCRSFPLGLSFDKSYKPSFAITIERYRRLLYDLEVRFQLTKREREAVEYLAEGLTSKEIAQRMDVSPNTVKTFLRLVMTKMGVTTRSALIGKIIEAAR